MSTKKRKFIPEYGKREKTADLEEREEKGVEATIAAAEDEVPNSDAIFVIVSDEEEEEFLALLYWFHYSQLNYWLVFVCVDKTIDFRVILYWTFMDSDFYPLGSWAGFGILI